MKYHLCAILVLISGFGFQLVAQENMNVDLVGRAMLSPIGRMQDIVIVDRYAYVVDEITGLVIVDIVNPEEPQIVGICGAPDQSNAVAVSGNYAYVADARCGLRIIDISDPAEPVEVGRLETGQSTKTVAIIGNYAYVGVYNNGIYIVDIADPTNPVEVNFVLQGIYADEIEIAGDYAYFVDNGTELTVVDVSNPEQPVVVGSLEIGHSVYSVSISGDYAAVSKGDDCMIVDISDPGSPEVLSSLDTGSFLADVMWSGDFIYCVSRRDGLVVLDASDPENLEAVSYLDLGENLRSAVYCDGHMFAGGNGFFAVDVSDPSQPEQVGEIESNGFFYDVEVCGDYAYVAAEEYVHVLDVSDPTMPVLLDSDRQPGNAYQIDIEGDCLVVADYSAGVRIYDVGDPYSLEEVATIGDHWHVLDVTISNGYAYIAMGGMNVVDISDPANPMIVYEDGAYSRSICIAGEYAYLVNGGLSVWDIHDPSAPVFCGAEDIGLMINGIDVVGNIAVIAGPEYGFGIYEVGDPENPEEICHYDVLDQAAYVRSDGDFAYVSRMYKGLSVVDTRDPYYPVETGYYDMPGCAMDLDVENGYVYVAEGNGIAIYDCSGAGVDDPDGDSPASASRLLGNSPNPFNPETTIRYSIATSGDVQLSIYNIRGEKVRTLQKGWQDSGEHSVVWDGHDQSGKPVSSGVYLSSLKTSDVSQTGKMLLLK